jgi:hypothetical protein
MTNVYTYDVEYQVNRYHMRNVSTNGYHKRLYNQLPYPIHVYVLYSIVNTQILQLNRLQALLEELLLLLSYRVACESIILVRERMKQHPPRFCRKSFLGGQHFSLEFSRGGGDNFSEPIYLARNSKIGEIKSPANFQNFKFTVKNVVFSKIPRSVLIFLKIQARSLTFPKIPARDRGFP